MTYEERMKAQARIAEIGRQMDALREERISLRAQLVHSAAEWIDAQRRLSVVQSREERGTAAVQARAARARNRDPNPPCLSLPRGDRDDDDGRAA